MTTATCRPLQLLPPPPLLPPRVVVLSVERPFLLGDGKRVQCRAGAVQAGADDGASAHSMVVVCLRRACETETHTQQRSRASSAAARASQGATHIRAHTQTHTRIAATRTPKMNRGSLGAQAANNTTHTRSRLLAISQLHNRRIAMLLTQVEVATSMSSPLIPHKVPTVPTFLARSIQAKSGSLPFFFQLKQ